MQKKEAPLLNTNMDTNLLKLIAVFTMVIDHVGVQFFPDQIWFRLVGRLTFPLFCYCMTVGMMYTRNIKKYLFRIGLFAIISQPFWIFAFNQQDFWGNLTNSNIFFTLFISLIGILGIKEAFPDDKKGNKKWLLLFVLSVVVLSMFNFDYGTTGLLYMVIFYCCRRRPKLGLTILLTLMLLPQVLSLCFPIYYNNFDFYIGSIGMSMDITSVFALPLIYFHTNVHPKINKYFFYVFYPLHLGIIGLVWFFIK